MKSFGNVGCFLYRSLREVRSGNTSNDSRQTTPLLLIHRFLNRIYAFKLSLIHSNSVKVFDIITSVADMSFKTTGSIVDVA